LHLERKYVTSGDVIWRQVGDETMHDLHKEWANDDNFGNFVIYLPFLIDIK